MASICFNFAFGGTRFAIVRQHEGRYHLGIASCTVVAKKNDVTDLSDAVICPACLARRMMATGPDGVR